MNKSDVIEKICSLSKDFYKRENISFLNLIEESGYLKFKNEITEQDIANFLKKNSELMETWIAYSLDQKSSPNWYIKSPLSLEYYDGRTSLFKEFSNPEEACAFFIMKKVN